MREPLRILMLEDSESDAELIRLELERGGLDFTFQRAETVQELEHILASGTCNVILSDFNMPAMTGEEALQIVRKRSIDCPFIFVSGVIGEEVAIAAMKSGAHDYVMKDNLHRLVPAIERELREAVVRRERRKAEAELHRAHEELELRVEQRTAELSRAYGDLKEEMAQRRKIEEERNSLATQLLQAQKLQAIGQMAAGMAHEINNPLGYIMSNLGTLQGYLSDIEQLLQGLRTAAADLDAGQDPALVQRRLQQMQQDLQFEFVSEDFRSALRDCREGSERIRDIVLRLKEFTHPSDDERMTCDLRDIVERSLRICGSELKYKAKVRTEFDVTPPLRCRPKQLEQVVVNLLVNAAQAITEKGEIVISTHYEGQNVLLSVRDTGHGIAPEHRQRLFEPFFTTKQVGQGTGLGLHVAYKIVKVHGGEIIVNSEVGKGSEFIIRLPVEMAQASHASPNGSSGERRLSLG